MDYNTAIDLNDIEAYFELVDSLAADDELSGSGMCNAIVGDTFDPGRTNSGCSQVAPINSTLAGNVLLSSMQPSQTSGSQFGYNVSTHYTS